MNLNTIKITSKVELHPLTYLFKFETQQKMDWQPGQFLVLQIEPRIFRSYSIVNIHENELTLLIDCKIGGPASKFFEASQIGTELNIVGKPLGKFVIQPNDKHKIFVATGTGLAPFIPMIASGTQPMSLFFGARFATDDYCKNLLLQFKANHPNLSLFRCLSQEDSNPAESIYKGRVTSIIPNEIKDYSDKEFYLCGNPAMVNEVTEILLSKGVSKDFIITEKYGN